MTRVDLEAWLTDKIAQELRLDSGAMDPGRPFSEYGLDSITSVTIVADLEDWLGCGELPSSLMWDYPTLAALTARVAALVPVA